MFRNMRKQLSLNEVTHGRLKSLADTNDMTIHRAGATILEFVLPKFESGELRLSPPSVETATQLSRSKNRGAKKGEA